MNKLEAQNLLNEIKFELFGKRFEIKLLEDHVYRIFDARQWQVRGRLYIQVSYYDHCRISGKLEMWSGRKWYLSDYMTEDEVVKTAYAACKACVEHEVMEAFSFGGKVLFNPHVNFRELLAITDKEVRRLEKPKNN